MTDRRYSIIPAGAVTDPNIERGDLRVLCYLGTCTDRLGWCYLAQGTIAEALECSRATVQRALARLVEAGWVQVRASTPAGRPHASHAYRVIMDRDDPKVHTSEFAVEGVDEEGGCSPVHTPVPIQGEQGCPPRTGTGVPTHTWAQNDQDSDLGGRDDARARGRAIVVSPEAHRLSGEIGAIAGHDPGFLPPRWVSDGAVRAQQMLDQGWDPDMLRETAREVMRAKRDGPPQSIRYFEQPFAKAHALRTRPAPLPEAPTMDRTHETSSASARTSGWQRSRDNFRDAFAELKAANRGQSVGEIGDAERRDHAGPRLPARRA
jgi:hypothetical protein